MMQKQTMQISGMTCAACANRVQRAVGKLEGVTEAVVNFGNRKAVVPV